MRPTHTYKSSVSERPVLAPHPVTAPPFFQCTHTHDSLHLIIIIYLKRKMHKSCLAAWWVCNAGKAAIHTSLSSVVETNLVSQSCALIDAVIRHTRYQPHYTNTSLPLLQSRRKERRGTKVPSIQYINLYALLLLFFFFFYLLYKNTKKAEKGNKKLLKVSKSLLVSTQGILRVSQEGTNRFKN